jgi:hypothetical protein
MDSHEIIRACLGKACDFVRGYFCVISKIYFLLKAIIRHVMREYDRYKK